MVSCYINVNYSNNFRISFLEGVTLNIAIIIGISEYTSAHNLPACKNDSDIINTIIETTNKYEKVLLINGSGTDNYAVKERIISFVKQNQKEQVNELFFYYSGHGKSDSNDFYYIMTDTKPDKLNSTSLQNTELDTLLKELNPMLFVKIVDACNSGIAYIKGDSSKESESEQPKESYEIFEKSLKEKKFSKCFFMSSSQVIQNSYADDSMSEFTKSFHSCILGTEVTKTLRYKQIIDYITDYFIMNNKQTPYFVIQADMTEIFCIVTDELISALSLTTKKSSENTEPVNEYPPKREDTILKALQQYVTYEKAIESVEYIRISFNNYQISNPFINELYEISVPKSNDVTLPSVVTIGKWIQENRISQKLFATPRFTDANGRKKIDGYNNTAKNLPLIDNICLTPKNLGLPKFNLYFVYIYSPTSIYIFYNFSGSEPSSWGLYSDFRDNGWQYISYLIKDISENNQNDLNDQCSHFEEYVLVQLEEFIRKN